MRHPKFQVVKAPDRNFYDGSRKLNWMAESAAIQIFLGGSIDMGKAVDWQKVVADGLENRPVRILSPRRDDFDSDLVQDISNPAFKEQVDWELDALKASDFILFYFDPAGKAPITLMELGIMAERVHHTGDHDIYVCCPEGYWRRGNVQIVCDRYGIEMFPDLDALIAKLHQRLDDWEMDDTKTW